MPFLQKDVYSESARHLPALARCTRAVGMFALTGEKAFQNLFDLDEEHEIGHIRLAREADLVVVAPATADLLAKMAHGLADDLASAVLLATDRPVLVAPAMNPRMWAHPATQRNVAQLRADGVTFVGPESVLIPSGAVGGRPGSGTPVGAGAIALDVSIAVAGLGATIDGLAGAAVEAVSRVADISIAGVTGGGVSAGLAGSTTATLSLPSVLSIR